MVGEFGYGDGDEEGVPLKLMLFVGGIGVLGFVFLWIAMSIDRKSPDGLYDPQSQVYQNTSPDMEEDTDLWVQKKPVVIPPPPSSALPSPSFNSSLIKPQDNKPVFPWQKKDSQTEQPAATQPN